MADPNASPFAGDWIYRSFLNIDTYPVETGDDAQTLKNFQALLFGEGRMRLEVDERGYFVKSGLDFGPDYTMRIEGVATGAGTTPCQEAPATARWKAFGDGSGTAGWVYEYVGFYAPEWPNGVNQAPAIVGSVIRVVPHGSSPAGTVASFVAVRVPDQS